MTRYTASHARAAVLAFALTVLLGVVAAGCDRPADVARCVERCEHLPPGCEYHDLTAVQGGAGTVCTCRCSFPMPFADAGAR